MIEVLNFVLGSGSVWTFIGFLILFGAFLTSGVSVVKAFFKMIPRLIHGDPKHITYNYSDLVKQAEDKKKELELIEQ